MCRNILVGCCNNLCWPYMHDKHEFDKYGPKSRIPYIIVLLISGIFATVMSLYGEKHLKLNFYDISCSDCIGNGSVFRVSMVLFLFELIHVIFILAGAISFHHQLIVSKIILYVLCVMATFFYGDNHIYNLFAEVARYGLSPLYLVLQILLLISWAYDVNELVKKRMNSENESKLICLLFLTSIIPYIISILILGFSFAWYGNGENINDSDCVIHQTLIALSIVWVVANAFISVCATTGTFLVSTIVSVYTTFLCFAALQTDNNENCNRFYYGRNNITFWIGLLLVVLSVCYLGTKHNLLETLIAIDDTHIPLLHSKEIGKTHQEDKATGLRTMGSSIQNKNNQKKNKYYCYIFFSSFFFSSFFFFFFTIYEYQNETTKTIGN